MTSNRSALQFTVWFTFFFFRLPHTHNHRVRRTHLLKPSLSTNHWSYSYDCDLFLWCHSTCFCFLNRTCFYQFFRFAPIQFEVNNSYSDKWHLLMSLIHWNWLNLQWIQSEICSGHFALALLIRCLWPIDDDVIFRFIIYARAFVVFVVILFVRSGLLRWILWILEMKLDRH